MRLAFLFICAVAGLARLAAEEAPEKVEQTFVLADGREITGVKVGEDDENLVIEVARTGGTAQVKLPKAALRATKAAERKPGATEAIVIKPASDPATPKQDDDIKGLAETKRLLREAFAEASADSPARERTISAPYKSPLPQDLDYTWYQLYPPLMRGAFLDSYQGLVYREGIAPRARYHYARYFGYNRFGPGVLYAYPGELGDQPYQFLALPPVFDHP